MASSNSLMLNHFATREIATDVEFFYIYTYVYAYDETKEIIFQYIEQLISKAHIMATKQQKSSISKLPDFIYYYFLQTMNITKAFVRKFPYQTPTLSMVLGCRDC